MAFLISLIWYILGALFSALPVPCVKAYKWWKCYMDCSSYSIERTARICILYTI